MHPTPVLWATPRSTSTAFEWMMRMRGDMTCFHEPFGEAWYKGDEALAAHQARQPAYRRADLRWRLALAAGRRLQGTGLLQGFPALRQALVER